MEIKRNAPTSDKTAALQSMMNPEELKRSLTDSNPETAIWLVEGTDKSIESYILDEVGEITDQAEAEKRVKNSLVLREIEKQEKIEVPESDIEKEAEHMLKHYPDIDKERLKGYAENILKSERILAKLESFAKR